MARSEDTEEMIDTFVQKMSGEAKTLDAAIDTQQKGILFTG